MSWCLRWTRAAIRHVAAAGTGTSSAVSYVPVTCARARSTIRHIAATRGLLPGLVLPGIGLPVCMESPRAVPPYLLAVTGRNKALRRGAADCAASCYCPRCLD